MAVYNYDSNTGNLTTVASSGQRTWVGTKAQFNAARQAGTLPLNSIVIITDDETEMDSVPTEGSPVAVTSGGLYNILGEKFVNCSPNRNYYTVDSIPYPAPTKMEAIVDDMVEKYGNAWLYGTILLMMSGSWAGTYIYYKDNSQGTYLSMMLHCYDGSAFHCCIIKNTDGTIRNNTVNKLAYQS